MTATPRARRLREMTDEEKFLYAATGTLIRDEAEDILTKRRNALEEKNTTCPASLTLREVRELTALRQGDPEEVETLLREARQAAQAPVPV